MAAMTGTEQLPERVDRIERKLDALTESVDRRFDEVSEHFVEQREYTEFAFERLRKEMLEGFNRLERKFDGSVERWSGSRAKARWERRTPRAAARRSEARWNVERLRVTELDTNTRGLGRLERKLDTNTRGLKRLESKLDRFIDGQAKPPRQRRSRRVPKKR